MSIESKEQLIKEIDNKTSIGRTYVESQKEFLKWLVSKLTKGGK